MAQVGQQRFGCYIGNIDRSVTLEVLRQVFSQCGTIVDCSLNGRDEDPYRYGFIDFATEDDRARAMKYNGFTLAGRKIKVGISKGNVGRPEGYSNSTNNSGSNVNNSNNMAKNPQQVQQPQVPAVALAASFLPNVVQQQQQQQSAQLLLQLIQQGALDINNLTADQQQILMASLLPQMQPTAPGIPAIPAAAPMPYAPMPPQQSWSAPRPGYHGAAPIGRAVPYTRPPANPQPSDETLKLREVQRKQFLDVVRRDAEKYERKLQERSVKEGRAGSLSGSADSSSDGEETKNNKEEHQRRNFNTLDQRAIVPSTEETTLSVDKGGENTSKEEDSTTHLEGVNTMEDEQNKTAENPDVLESHATEDGHEGVVST
ncbi:putative RNA recognition motif (a k a RRM RBD or RNP domain) [Trypanosoma vivax]|uniref:Putative RNA-binding protein n=1 Tax=Trypanosoma vivax (strain Y486) TaxID=1055687 RepID=G0U4C2_TRYVY|nr:putative RNA-binding protein [Trypanosoma vivax]KAH8611998.1 putative RNA recognition motif (a k a RRM RBD or RNP domain) [Trypanosoma vivax]CCC52286.1 putative RNA-binding protein [Trypanosoma vivax Y486]